MSGPQIIGNLFIRFAIIAASASATIVGATPAFGQRVKGLDTSSIATSSSGPTQEQWNTAFSQDYRFAFLRSGQGGTVEGNFDDPAFYNGISRATTAGLLSGSYHFTRPDLTGHSGADEGTHYLNYAGMYMKPGYLLPVVDVERLLGGVQNPSGLTAWVLDMVTTIESQKGITPLIYLNSSYANDQVQKSLAFNGSTPRTYQWVSRPGGNGLTGEPPPSTVPPGFPNPYGMWDPNFVSRPNSREPAFKPWVFWQQTLDTTPAGLFKIDINYANGNIEFVKDFLVPALWTNAGSGDWGTLANWNSDNPTYNGTIQSGPAPRLPNNSSLDWVKLQNSGGGTVTISSGTRTVRKLYTQQPLNITGGSLSVGYIPGSGGKWDLPSEFKASVTLSSGASYSAHTTQVSGGGGVFNINGGTLTFREIQLAKHGTDPGRIVIGGDATFAQTGGAGTSVIRHTGSLAESGSIQLSAGNRTFTVNNGSAAVDLDVRVSIIGTGRLVKSGAGTMQLSTANSYNGGTTITSGVLQITADDRLGAVPGSPQSDNIILNGGTLRTGAQINTVSLTNAGSGYTSFPTLSIGGAGADVHAASANVLAGINSIALTNGGSGYVNQTGTPTAGNAGTFVDIIGGGGTGATARATVVGGVVTGITILNPGSGYTSMPSIFISSTGIDIDPGPTTQNVAGSGATASVNGITLQNIALNDGGFDYTTPTLSLTGGGGSGATASATSSPNLTLNSNRGISLTAGGGTLYQTAGTTLTIGGVISSSGNGALTKSGPGTLTLNRTHTYTGNTIINGGVLQYTSTANLGSPSNSIVFNGGTLRPLADLNETRNITLNAGGGTFDIPVGTTLSGVISGTGNLTKGGSGGHLTLTNDNTYTGTTTVSAGTLVLSGASASLGTGNVTVLGTTAGSALVIQSGVNNAIDDGATLNLLGGGAAGVADQGYASLGAGISEVIGSLLLNGIMQPSGTYGSSDSNAMYKLNDYFTGTGILSVIALAGDYNNNGLVDAADYVVWRHSQSASTPMPNDPTPATVDVDDYGTWTANFGKTNEAGSGSSRHANGAVPEPMSIALFGLGWIVLLFVSRRQRRNCA